MSVSRSWRRPPWSSRQAGGAAPLLAALGVVALKALMVVGRIVGPIIVRAATRAAVRGGTKLAVQAAAKTVAKKAVKEATKAVVKASAKTPAAKALATKAVKDMTNKMVKEAVKKTMAKKVLKEGFNAGRRAASNKLDLLDTLVPPSEGEEEEEETRAEQERTVMMVRVQENLQKAGDKAKASLQPKPLKPTTPTPTKASSSARRVGLLLRPGTLYRFEPSQRLYSHDTRRGLEGIRHKIIAARHWV